MSSTDLRQLCQPIWATPRRPDRDTLGGEASRIARLLGEPLMPWQQQNLDVSLELLTKAECDELGMPWPRLAYRENIITIPRQSGKTQLWLTLACHRSVPIPGSPRPWSGIQRSAFTMQSGWDAHKKLVNDQGPKVIHSNLSAALDDSRGNGGLTRGVGNAALLFKGGSRIDIVSTTETGGHGLTLDLGGIDEAFADVDERREQSLLPTMSTRNSPQLLITSTAGTDASVYLRRKVEVGRAAVERGRSAGVCYHEWSAPSDGQSFPDGHISNIDDEGTWWRCMPALGHTIGLDVIRHARDTMTEGDFRRAYLNQWTTTSDRVIPEDVWVAVCDPLVIPKGSITVAVDVPPDRSTAAIGAADAEGNLELIDSRPGTSWVVERLAALALRHQTPVALDMGGPAGALAPDLINAGVTLIEMRSAQVTQACGGFYDAVADSRLRVRYDDRLDLALAHASKHPVGDAWRWGRRSAVGDVTPIVAITLAHWAAKQHRDATPTPRVISLDDI